MWNNKGSTLIESLFAFFLFITIIIYFVTAITSLNQSSLRLQSLKQEQNSIELDLGEKGEDSLSAINQVLP